MRTHTSVREIAWHLRGNGQLVAAWVDAWAPVVQAAGHELLDLEAVIFDSTNFYSTSRRGRRREFAVLLAYGYPVRGPGRIVSIHAGPTTNVAVYERGQLLLSTNVDNCYCLRMWTSDLVYIQRHDERETGMDDSAGRATQAPAGTGTDPGTRLIARWTDLGWAIREARLAQGLSQHRLADRAGVSRAWLAHVETGHRKAEFELLMRTLEALGLSFSIGPTPTACASDPELDEALRIAGLQ